LPSKSGSELFDAYYFAHDCGRPYQRDEDWLQFFDAIAERIVNDLQPKTVLDAGCAMGFLVEMLRKRGVEAYGIDISEYAIANVHEDIRPFCWIASVVDPLAQKYDLIVCIEVLEHLKPAEAEKAIANLCQYTTQVLFSSTPSDYGEATHFNVRPPSYWAELFARHSFFHDLEFEALFLTPWAMLFRREELSALRVARNYEHKQWQLQQEIADLRGLSLEMKSKLAAAEQGEGQPAEPPEAKQDPFEPLAEEIAKTQQFLLEMKSELADHETITIEKAKLEATQAELREQIRQSNEEIVELHKQILVYQGISQEKEDLEQALELERNRVAKLQIQLQEKEEIEAHKKKLEALQLKTRQLLELERARNKDLLTSEERLQKEKTNLEDLAKGLSQEKQIIQGRLTEVESHVGWRLVTKIQRTRIKLFPTGSSRERIWKAGVAFCRAWLDIGFLGALKKAFASIRGKPIGHTPDSEYQSWIKSSEPSLEQLNQQRKAAGSFPYRPLISVITPVYHPPPDILKDAIESVLAQTYDHWEMCIADASCGDHKLRTVLESYSRRDERIKIRFLESNEGIAGNSNRALELAEGEFIAIFDHDDRLAPNALFEVVQLLNEKRGLDIFYFDEDKLSSDGKERRDPWFKPDWSPELLLSANYLMHSVIRRILVEELQGFDKSMDGAQDWDLLLRCTEKTEKIAHIPKVLYHWRQLRGSAASDLLAKPWVFENQLRCVRAHLERMGIAEPEARFDNPGFLRVSWPVLDSKVSIIIPSKDKVDFLRRCIESIIEITSYSNYEIIVVDNNSREKGTLDYYQSLKNRSEIRVVPFPGEFNFSAAINLGAREAQGKLLLFLNNDIEIIESDWLEEMVRWAERPEIGIVGAKLLYPNGLIQHAGVIIGMQGHASHVFMGSMEKQTGPFGSVDWYRNYSAVTGACLMMRKDIFDQVGGFDEGYQLVFSDVELCLRVLKNGYRVLYTPYVRLWHYEGQSRGFHIPACDMLRGYEHMKEMVERGDLYYNENLSYGSQTPTIIQANEETRIDRLRRLVGGANI
jgi:GT2 family glycosyltransferase/SAM-dependent methyltransferase